MNKILRFKWIKEFVFSDELEQEVALAGFSDDDIVLIDVFGNILENLSTE